MNYTIKIYNRSNAELVSESIALANAKDAMEYYNSVGFGEGYWAELVSHHGGYSVTRVSNA